MQYSLEIDGEGKKNKLWVYVAELLWGFKVSIHMESHSSMQLSA